MNDGASGSAGSRWPAASLLGRLPEPVRNLLLGLGMEVNFPAGRRILRQGEQGDTAYLLLNGYVRVSGIDGDREPLLAVRVGGDLIGEMAVLSGRRRSASVSTCTETLVRAISGIDLRVFLQSYPEAALEVASMLSERLRWANERRVDFAALDARTRICRVLLAMAETYGRDVGDGRDLGVPLTQEDVAALAGVRLTTAEKALRAFAHAGLLRLGYRSIVIVDLRRLAAAGRRPNSS